MKYCCAVFSLSGNAKGKTGDDISSPPANKRLIASTRRQLRQANGLVAHHLTTYDPQLQLPKKHVIFTHACGTDTPTFRALPKFDMVMQTNETLNSTSMQQSGTSSSGRLSSYAG